MRLMRTLRRMWFYAGNVDCWALGAREFTNVKSYFVA